MPDDLFQDRFHYCALAAGLQALCEGRLHDSEYVKRLAYASYERGDFAGGLTEQPPCANSCGAHPGRTCNCKGK